MDKHIVQQTRIIGTDVTVWTVWEPYNGHGTQQTIDGVNMGRIGSRKLTKTLDAMERRSVQRQVAVVAWQEAQYAEAYLAIYLKHPFVAYLPGAKSMGDIRA